MNVKPIKTNKNYIEALSRMEKIFQSPAKSKEGDEAEVLSLLIENYENKHFSIEAPDPIEAIKIRMEELGLERKDLFEIIGERGKVSEVLNRKRKLSLSMIRKLNKHLSLSPEILIQDYKLSL